MCRVQHGFEYTPMRLHKKKVMQIWNAIPNLHNFLCVYPLSDYTCWQLSNSFL